MSLFASKITGIGSGFPQKILTNQDLSKRVDTSDEWIKERTGISERRIVERGLSTDSNSMIAFKASKKALEMANKSVADIDAIFYATCSPETFVPSTACWLQHHLGAKKAFVFDLNAACSGFVYGLSIADQFIKSGQIKTALVVGSEVISELVNWNDRTSCILFGDGAGAAIVEQTSLQDTSRILSTHLQSDGDLWELFHIPAGGTKLPITPEISEKGLDKMHMKGKEIFKVAVTRLADFAHLAVQSNGYKIQDLDWIVPHQANMRIIEAVAKKIDFPMSKVIVNIDRFGNTSAATVPTAMDEAVRDGRIKKGQLVLLDVFGAGLTYGSLLLRW